MTTETTTEAVVDKTGVDYDLSVNVVLNLTGRLNENSGVRCIQLANGMSFYGFDIAGNEVRLDGIKVAYIDAKGEQAEIVDGIELQEILEIKGNVYLKDGNVWIEPVVFYDARGLTIDKKSLAKKDEYILPDSDKRLLTEADIGSFSLQEINYAKNEIYARHGRKFASKELQDYFDSKSWYNGTIAPEQFSESWLSSIELANAKFLSDTEFRMAPNGYQLDK